ncbi:hypothetical protein K491DRAFT_707674 [Lophiostoma macrostomum CBS 122681]|uniref:DUF7703 domain-containing protein n=1 Tax=Lophiostoma macrostomum CBS 122681 TaxID=1314788 RepID=A0A6A6SR95_9PLEO|nr:hypothetical protein K491DRAFT_707674 [Lophiostoma macrostomum CBS 122681]
MATASPTSSTLPEQTAPAQGSLDSAGAGITGGYTGDSLSLKVIIAFLIGLALYNAVELMILVFITFNRYKGLYFWSLIVAGFGVIPYALGFLIKFFQLLDPNQNEGYLAVVFLTIGWYMMITGQSVVLWSRLHLVTTSRRILSGTKYMIIFNAVTLHTVTTVLTFGSNSNSLTPTTLNHFVRGYNIMEKIQMVGFFVQELILSLIYIKETVRLLRLSEAVIKGEVEAGSVVDESNLSSRSVRKTMNQLIIINAIIIAMDIALLAVEFANLYLIETTLKGVVYSIKLKLEFAVLSKLVQLVRTHSDSGHGESGSGDSAKRRGTATGSMLEKSNSGTSVPRLGSYGHTGNLNARMEWPDFVDPDRVEGDVTRAEPVRPGVNGGDARGNDGWEGRKDNVNERERWKRRARAHRNSWIDQEMDKHNIG